MFSKPVWLLSFSLTAVMFLCMLDIAFDVAIISLWVNLEDICLAVVISDLYLIFFF